MYWFLPLTWGHPSWKATFMMQKGWPHKRGSTVERMSTAYRNCAHICRNFFMSKSRDASYLGISSFKPFYPHKSSHQNQQWHGKNHVINITSSAKHSKFDLLMYMTHINDETSFPCIHNGLTNHGLWVTLSIFCKIWLYLVNISVILILIFIK